MFVVYGYIAALAVNLVIIAALMVREYMEGEK